MAMKRIIRTYLAIALSFMLAFTGQGMAVARGMPGPAGQMVLCTGSGPVMISVDSEGQPLGTPHICPDGALLLIHLAFAAPDTASIDQSTGRIACWGWAAQETGIRLAGTKARDPPVSG